MSVAKKRRTAKGPSSGGQAAHAALGCGCFDPEAAALTREAFQTLAWLSKEEPEELAARLEEVGRDAEEAGE